MFCSLLVVFLDIIIFLTLADDTTRCVRVTEELTGLQNEEREIQTVDSSDNHGECIVFGQPRGNTVSAGC